MSLNFQDKTSIDVPDPNIQDMFNCFSQLQARIRPGLNDTEVLSVLNIYIQAGDLEKLAKGLVYGSLSGYDWFKFLFIGSQDLLILACTSFASLAPTLKSRQPAVSLFTKFMKSNCPGFPELFVPFLRTFDLTSELRSELDWVFNSQFISLIFYKLLRSAALALAEASPLVADYSFLIQALWRQKRESCLMVGRDLIRLLPCFPEASFVEPIWNDLNSQSRDGSYLYWSLLCLPTQFKYHSVLLTPGLESRVVFVIENSSGMNYMRYLKWIVDEYGEHLIPDIIRFIVNFPANKETTPRWQIITWLLGISNDHQIQASSKQALIYDALFFNQADLVLTIEPLMSILKHSLSKTPVLTEEILEFLMTSAEIYDKRSVAGIMRSLRECFNVAYFNRLIPSLDAFANDEKIDTSIKAKLLELLDSSCNSESSHDEETPPATPRPYELFGEAGNEFTNEPSFDKFEQILMKNPVSKELVFHVLRSLPHELSPPVLMEIAKNSVIYQMFAKAENDEKFFEFLKIAAGVEGLLGVRALIYSLQLKNNLYFRIDGNLEKDLRTCVDEVSLDTLNWIFPHLLVKQKMTIGVFFYFLSTANHEVLFQTELNLHSKAYKLMTPFLTEVLNSASKLPSMEKKCLWRLLCAEVRPSHLKNLIDFCSEDYFSENWSGLLDYFQIHRKDIQANHVQSLLLLPFHLCSVVAALIAVVQNNVVVDAVLNVFRIGNLNCLAHFRYWVKNRLVICEVINCEQVQEALQGVFQNLSNKDAEEFFCLIEGKRASFAIR
jgi:hypothetical protein